jgi:hypothetical protein
MGELDPRGLAVRPASLHREPAGGKEILRHYIRDIVYGANDGIITTFAVVAGATGGALSVRAVIVIGIANLLADGVSMGLAITYRSARTRAREPPSACRKKRRARSATAR